MPVLIILFAIIAALYASVGFGGGSSYLALLVLWQLPYTLIPSIALICNIIVVSGNSFHYTRAGHLNWRMLLPTTVLSIPCAYLGGRIPVSEQFFIIILAAALLVSGIQLLLTHRSYDGDPGSYRPLPIPLGLGLGAGLGFLAGLVGIGGGIFLAPLLYHLRAGPPRQIATTASLFILVNSIAGLIGQTQKTNVVVDVASFWYLPLMVLIGGQIGNFVSINWISARVIALLTAILIIFVAIRLLFFVL